MDIVLSKNLKKVLDLITRGFTDAEIAKETGYSIKTVEKQVRTLKNIYKTERRIVLAVEHAMELIAEGER